MTDLPVAITLEVTQHLEALGIAYMLVGSVASSLLGVARSTIDADIVADLRTEHAESLRQRLEADFYVSAVAMQDALLRRSMFNVVQFKSGFKIDIYVLGERPFDREEFARRREYDGMAGKLWVATIEDLILSKMDWYRLGNEVSERQWRDLLGLLQIHRNALDGDYLQKWARELQLEPLWERAQRALAELA